MAASSSVLPHHKHFPTFFDQCVRRRIITCSAPTTTTKARPNHHQSLTIRPRLANTSVGEDPALQSTWSHRAWVAAGCTTLLISLAKAVANSHVLLEPILAGYVGYVIADLASGVYHWAIDNYGDGSTPFFGSQIAAFQGHHRQPWTITRRQFANNLYALGRATTFFVLPIDFVSNDPVVHAFVGMCFSCLMFGQQFHSWAHMTKSRLPRLVVALQDAGVLVSRRQHAAHHRPPYNNNYCIVSGVWNEFLDRQKVFEALELVLFFRLGVKPRSWSEPNADWTEEVIENSSEQVTVHKHTTN